MEEKKLWYVEGHPNFPFAKGYTFAKDRKIAAWNVGWRNGLRSDSLDYFVGNTKVLTSGEARNRPPETEEEPCTLEELNQSLKVLEGLGTSSENLIELHNKIEQLIEQEVEEGKNSKQLILHFPPKNK